MKKTYKQLTLLQRYQIQVKLEASFTLTDIAYALCRNKSTISRELKRCRSGYYDTEMAHADSSQKRKNAFKSTRHSPELWETITKGLEARLSPAAIAGRLELEPKKNRFVMRLFTNGYHCCPVNFHRKAI
jgi:IS30 family transposase